MGTKRSHRSATSLDYNCLHFCISLAGYLGTKIVSMAIQKRFCWRSFIAQVQYFVKFCLNFLSATGGTKIFVSLNSTVHGVKPKNVLQLDYFELGSEFTAKKYELLLRDHIFKYCWLFSGCSQKRKECRSCPCSLLRCV